jgi:hypothetical protein
LAAEKIPITDKINYQFPGECHMIINDLNVMESVEGAAVIGGAGKPSGSVKVDRNFTTRIDNSVKTRADIQGNTASGDFGADAYGRDTFTDGYVRVKTTPGSSSSHGGAIAVTGGGGRKY